MIQITTLKGTNSVASDRITINDNFNILKDTSNDILNYLNVQTGELTSLQNIETVDITVGNHLNISEIGKIFIGSKFINKSVLSTVDNTYNFIELSNFDGVSVPKKTTAELVTLATDLEEIANSEDRPAVIIFNSTTGKFVGYDGNNFVNLQA